MIYTTHRIVQRDLGPAAEVTFAEVGVYEAQYASRLLTVFNVKKA